MGVVGGAVNGIHDPAVRGRRRREAFLFAKDLMVGVAFGDRLADEGLGHTVDLGHDVDVALVLDALNLALMLAQDGPGLAGDFLGE
ncbi:hypothetical protein D3C78_1611120 [compost metagenome]